MSDVSSVSDSGLPPERVKTGCPRVLAFYLPQFHPIPENDEWWEKGFTEWTNVGKARKLFRNHYQPKLPTELGYYDLRVPETREAQASLAREYGIEGFVYWHYWFGEGRMLLERPFREVLESGKPDFPFCLAWANESWRGFHHGLKRTDSLIEQTYGGEKDYRRHFETVLPAFRDPRYVTVDSRPLFLIYHPLHAREEITEMISMWRRWSLEAGLKGIYFVGMTYFIDKEKEDLEAMGLDGINVCRFHEFKKHHSFLYHRLQDIQHTFKVPLRLPYKKVYPTLIGEEERQENIYPTLFPNWDHTPRTGWRGTMYSGESPELFGKLLDLAVDRVKDKSPDHQLIFVKSWNEWGEGNYLEPDRVYGRGYLEEIGSRVKGCRR